MTKAKLRVMARGLTVRDKRSVAQSMYMKGKHFIGAALAIRKQQGYEFVVLHLLCQGVEIVLKALLLLNDFDRYHGTLRSELGHDLERLSRVTVEEFGVRPLSDDLVSEIETLNSFYSSQILRSESVVDLLILPETIPSDLVLLKIQAVIKLSERQLSKSASRPRYEH